MYPSLSWNSTPISTGGVLFHPTDVALHMDTGLNCHNNLWIRVSVVTTTLASGTFYCGTPSKSRLATFTSSLQTWSWSWMRISGFTWRHSRKMRSYFSTRWAEIHSIIYFCTFHPFCLLEKRWAKILLMPFDLSILSILFSIWWAKSIQCHFALNPKGPFGPWSLGYFEPKPIWCRTKMRRSIRLISCPTFVVVISTNVINSRNRGEHGALHQLMLREDRCDHISQPGLFLCSLIVRCIFISQAWSFQSIWKCEEWPLSGAAIVCETSQEDKKADTTEL